MTVKVWVRDDEFGEDFQVDVAIDDLIVALKQSGLPTVHRVPDGEGRIKVWRTSKPVRNPGVWLCVRVGDDC